MSAGCRRIDRGELTTQIEFPSSLDSRGHFVRAILPLPPESATDYPFTTSSWLYVTIAAPDDYAIKQLPPTKSHFIGLILYVQGNDNPLDVRHDRMDSLEYGESYISLKSV